MFYDYKIEVWEKGQSYKNKIKQMVRAESKLICSINGDVQPYSKEEAYKDYGFTVECVKRLYIDKMPLEVENNYFVIDGLKYEIAKIPGEWDEYMEVLINAIC